MRKCMLFLASLSVLALPLGGCQDDDDETIIRKDNKEAEVVHRDAPAFVRGCDPSWVTEMEDAGWTFRDADGKEGDCLEILKGVGFEACRLRCWVNPSGGYCNTQDVLAKALRAQALGYYIMINFHYSDGWADPGQQHKPSVWDDAASVEEMAGRLYNYTRNVLRTLYVNGIDVTWVQIGNESRVGMCTTNSDGSATDVSGESPEDYVTLHAAGCKAVKEIYPQAKTILHFENAQKEGNITYRLNKLVLSGIEFDILGLSLYPYFTDDNWYENYIENSITAMNNVSNKYGCDVMLVELGCEIDNANAAKALRDAVVRSEKEVSACKGVFYWEPEAYDAGEGSWNGYGKGAFTASGSPSEELIAAFAK